MGNDNQETTELGDRAPSDGQSADVQKLKEERDGLHDRLLRKQAEFENYKKRVEREKSEFVQFASAELIKELLNAIDSFDLAIHKGSLDEQAQKGFDLIHKQLLDTLSRFGLK